MPSTVIKSFYYEEQRLALHITFLSGNKYVYKGVSRETYAAMKKAFSKGQYFNEHIKPHYEFEREDDSL